MLSRNKQDLSDPQDELVVSNTLVARIAPVPPDRYNGGWRGGNGGSGGDACALVSVNLAAYADGELDADLKAAVESHVSHCVQCNELLDNLTVIDKKLKREWRSDAPLPISSQAKASIENIMAALPGVPDCPPLFAARRVHARARWMRFSTGFAGIVALMAMLGSSYRIGYNYGRKVALAAPAQSTNVSLVSSFDLPDRSSPVSGFPSGTLHYVGARH